MRRHRQRASTSRPRIEIVPATKCDHSRASFELSVGMDGLLMYLYWPEGDRTRTPGMLRMDLVDGYVSLVEPAEDDYLVCTVRQDDGSTYELWKYADKVIEALMASDDPAQLPEAGMAT